MFENLKNFSKIIVTGPQRSGTRICAKMIAADTGYEYFDESVISVKDVAKLQDLLKYEKNFVIQAPGISFCVEDFAADDTLIVFMMRDIPSILASQKTCGWGCNDRELKKYGLAPGRNACEVKYDFWNDQKELILWWREVQYDSLKDHPLYLAEEKRKGFTAYQTSV